MEGIDEGHADAEKAGGDRKAIWKDGGTIEGPFIEKAAKRGIQHNKRQLFKVRDGIRN